MNGIKKNDLWIKLLFLAIYTKKKASDECYSDIIIKKYCKEVQKFDDMYLDFINDSYISNKTEKPNITEINKKFILLNKPINTFCKKKIIDYNNIVDRIINSFQPYAKKESSNSKGNQIFNHQNKAIFKNKVESNRIENNSLTNDIKDHCSNISHFELKTNINLFPVFF